MCFELLKGMDIEQVGQCAITSIIFQNELLDGKKIIQLNPPLNTTRPLIVPA